MVLWRSAYGTRAWPRAGPARPPRDESGSKSPGLSIQGTPGLCTAPRRVRPAGPFFAESTTKPAITPRAKKRGPPCPLEANGHPPLHEAQASNHPSLQEAQASSHPPPPQEVSAVEEARSSTYGSSAPANGQPRNADRRKHLTTKSAGQDADEADDARANEAAQPHEAADSRATKGSLHPDLPHAQSPASDAVKTPTTFRVPGALRGPPPATGTGVAGPQPIENGHLNPAATDSTIPAQAICAGPDEGPL
ncbi:PREDICTED: uncharacterized protein LOC105456515 [Wasmannia auropunctata]|uniref:uncharacterized protein LOC105456515 n=1 Tax=Wasmannia auropunctata TaxID=64793 RepID=UPI0005EEBA2B|nr:PREDICTED: uncharacterized protein LOC105456515 [Wasmannia auropunctata]